MELWPLISLSVFLSTCIYLTVFNFKKRKLPPGPPAFPLVGNLLWLRRSFIEIEAILVRDLFKKLGPVVTLHIGPRPMIIVSDRAVAHKALVEHGAAFADRPPANPARAVISGGQCSISSASYGPTWRLLRRNLMSEILHPSRIGLFAGGREWVLGVLIDNLNTQSSSSDGVVVAMDGFQFAMFCLLVLMCFGEKLDEKAIREIEAAHRDLLLYGRYLNVFAIMPAVSKYVFFGRWRTATAMRRRQKELCLPLIKARREHKRKQQDTQERFTYSYLDSLLDVKEEGGRNLTEDEMVSLCSEFLNAGTDTTATALQWIMAELVRHPDIQQRLVEEIESVARHDGAVREEELQKMPYLKAVVMEGLRRHPPGHFVLHHAVTRPAELGGYVVPKEASVNFTVAVMGRDERVWEEPMEFRPERFLDGDGRGVDITGSREIKMMPFGVGRRICPGLGLAMLHLEYFVANLVREFEWRGVDGEEVDMSEKSEFTVVMKHPLRARLIPRRSGDNNVYT